MTQATLKEQVRANEVKAQQSSEIDALQQQLRTVQQELASRLQEIQVLQ